MAMKNRGAHYGIFIVKYRDALPKKLGWFHELTGNILVCAMGDKASDTQFQQIIALAITFAKFRLQKEVDLKQETLATITENVTQISRELDKFRFVQLECTNIERSTTAIREHAALIKREINDHIVIMKQRITSPALNNTAEEEK